QRVRRLRRALDRLGMRSVIETGARFLLDPRRKHEPTLVTDDPAGRARRIDFYRWAIDCAAELGSDCVSLWSGAPAAGLSRSRAMDFLAEGLRQVLLYAESKRVPIGFEPEPGMLIDSMRTWEELLARTDAPSLRLTLDVGHLCCQGELPVAGVLRRWSDRLVNVHIEDMRAGVHEHLMFGEGQIDFPEVLRALRESGYAGGLYVELSRHSHVGPDAARRAMEYLAPLLRQATDKSEIRNPKSETNPND
ncbi:MAG: sugar phosphate isomerase/epimerase family protein, partial [Thermoguttaceae bacterium]